MRINFEFKLGDEVIEKATAIRGRVVVLGRDDVGNIYEIHFQQPTMGRRRHWKRAGEIELAPKPKKVKGKSL